MTLGVTEMPDYKAMYYALAAQVADAIDLLINAQRDGEESAITDERILPFPSRPEYAKEPERD